MQKGESHLKGNSFLKVLHNIYTWTQSCNIIKGHHAATQVPNKKNGSLQSNGFNLALYFNLNEEEVTYHITPHQQHKTLNPSYGPYINVNQESATEYYIQVIVWLRDEGKGWPT